MASRRSWTLVFLCLFSGIQILFILGSSNSVISRANRDMKRTLSETFFNIFPLLAPEEEISYEERQCRDTISSFIEDKPICTNCSVPLRSDGDLSSCDLYFEEGYMTRETYSNILGSVVSHEQFDVTLVTQLTVDRLDRLETVANYWHGAISAAIYIERSKVHTIFIDRICSSPLFAFRKNIIYSIMIENGTFYPVNSLRNLALNVSQTPYVLLSDVDLIPKPKLDREIYDMLSMGKLNESNTVWVVPAFETLRPTEQTSEFIMPTNKAKLKILIKQGKVQTFLVDSWPRGYNWTQYEKWLQVEEQYEVVYEKDFEPYIIIRRNDCPFYDERFVSRYRNKVQHLELLHLMGYKFLVLPDSFLIHLYHSNWKDTEAVSGQYLRVYNSRILSRLRLRSQYFIISRWLFVLCFRCANRVYNYFKKDMKKLYPTRYAEFWKRYPGSWS